MTRNHATKASSSVQAATIRALAAAGIVLLLAHQCPAQAIPPPQPNIPHFRIFQTEPIPQARTPAEYQAYANAAAILGAVEAEKSADQFARDYPESALRYLLFLRLMDMYQEASNNEGVLRNGRKALALHPNDPVALVITSTVLTETTHLSDPDRRQRYTEAIENARKAINNIDTGLVIPVHTPTMTVQEAKDSLLSAAHCTIGIVEFARGHDAEAEKEFRAALDSAKAYPDALLWLRLSLVQDHEKEYAEALQSANEALRLADGDASMHSLAQQQHDRLLRLTRGKETPSEPAHP